MKIEDGEKWVVCGGSSGLGQAFARHAKAEFSFVDQMLMSRRSSVSVDFSRPEDWTRSLELLIDYKPTRLFYFAGGGPHGPFGEKKWTSHEWAFRVNFLFPAFLLSHLKVPSLKQALFVGSAIAESKPDPLAASYSAAKHGLKGLVTSLQQEKSCHFDLRLLSPGYLDTPLLPQHAWPRQTPGLLKSPDEVAASTLSWVQDVQGANGHFILG
jgi:short-subunit dehydrogenase